MALIIPSMPRKNIAIGIMAIATAAIKRTVTTTTPIIPKRKDRMFLTASLKLAFKSSIRIVKLEPFIIVQTPRQGEW